MPTKEEMYAEAWRRGILPQEKKERYYEAVKRGLMKNPELLSQINNGGNDYSDDGLSQSEPPAEHAFNDLESVFMDVGRGIGRGSAGIIENLANTYLDANAELNKMIGIGDGSYTPVNLQEHIAKIFPDSGSDVGKIAEYAPEMALTFSGWGAGERAAQAVQALPKLQKFIQSEKVIPRLSQWALKTLGGSVGAQAATGKIPDEQQIATDFAINTLMHGTGKVLGMGYRAVTGTPDADMKALVDLAKNYDVPLLTSDVFKPKSGVGKTIQTYSEQIPFIGTAPRRVSQQSARIRMLDKLSSEYIQPSSGEIYESLVRQRDKVKSAAGERYKKIGDAMGEQPINLTLTIKEIERSLDELSKPGVIRDESSISSLEKIKEHMSAAPQSFEMLKTNRTNFRNFVQGERAVLPTNTDRLMQRIYKAMTSDLEQAVQNKLGNQTLHKYRQANVIYADEANKIMNTRLKHIFEKGGMIPEAALKGLYAKNPSEIKAFYRSLDNRGKNAARSELIASAIAKSTEETSGQPIINPTKFINIIKALNEQSGIVFKGDEAQMIGGINKLLNATRRAQESAASPATGQKLIPLSGVALGSSIGLVKALAAIAGTGAAAQIYESPLIRDALIKLAGTPAGSTAFEQAINRALEVVRSSLVASDD